MQNIKAHDADNKLVLIDCSAPEFDESPFKKEGIDRALMMNRLHAQDSNGTWLVGVEAFEVIYKTVGMVVIAKLWGGALTKPLAERLYPWVVRHRYILSIIGLPALFELLSKQAARKAEKHSRACAEGRCEINEIKP
jgi:predicted DCC family thiol-disulfide oxidoreductase YuxK